MYINWLIPLKASEISWWYNFTTMALPIVEHYIQLRDETVSLVKNHKVASLTVVAFSLLLVLFGVWAMRVRSTIIAGLQAPRKESSSEAYVAAVPTPESSSSAYTSILGTSEDLQLTNVEVPYYPPVTLYPVITQIPLPTPTPYQFTPTTTSSSSSCTGQPTVDNSQVYVTPTSTAVGNSASIEVDLQDCNNVIAPVSDLLKISLVSGNATFPSSVETKNGKVTFSVTSATDTTATFLITDTTRSFAVTTPGYHNPSVTFTSGSTGSTGNANCTTSAGAPNTWYSDVYPNPPLTTSTGSISLQVVIRDCFKNTTSVNDSLSISLSSGDANTKVNGNSLPYSVSAQNGVANFTVSSQVNGTVTLVVTDTAGGFTITDPNNHNPSITFSGGSSSSPTSTPTPTPTTAAADTPTPTPVPSPTTTATSSGTTP